MHVYAITEYDYAYIYILSIYIYRNFVQFIGIFYFNVKKFSYIIYLDIHIFYLHLYFLMHLIHKHIYRKFVQFIGKVCPNNCLEVFKIIQMKNGNNFDMGLYDKVVELSNNKFSHLFL